MALRETAGSWGIQLREAAEDLGAIKRLDLNGVMLLERATETVRSAGRDIYESAESMRRHVEFLERRVELLEDRLARRVTDVQADVLKQVVLGKGRPKIDPHGFHVYLLWGASKDRPIYVGQSTNVLSRLGQHMISEKRRLTRAVEILRLNSFKEMAETEKQLIVKFQPPLNTQFMPRGRAVWDS